MLGSRFSGKAKSTCRTFPKAERVLRKRRPKPTSLSQRALEGLSPGPPQRKPLERTLAERRRLRSEEHTSELQSQSNLVCRLLLEKKKNKQGASSVYAVEI